PPKGHANHCTSAGCLHERGYAETAPLVSASVRTADATVYRLSDLAPDRNPRARTPYTWPPPSGGGGGSGPVGCADAGHGRRSSDPERMTPNASRCVADRIPALDPLADASRHGRHRPRDLERRALEHCADRPHGLPVRDARARRTAVRSHHHVTRRVGRGSHARHAHEGGPLRRHRQVHRRLLLRLDALGARWARGLDPHPRCARPVELSVAPAAPVLSCWRRGKLAPLAASSLPPGAETAKGPKQLAARPSSRGCQVLELDPPRNLRLVLLLCCAPSHWSLRRCFRSALRPRLSGGVRPGATGS